MREMLIAVALMGLAPLSARAQQSQVEDIYIARSWRESRTVPTAYCSQSRTGFANANLEDRYSFRSTQTRSSDGKMTNASGNTIGVMHACFATAADTTHINFYAEGTFAGVPYIGKGECVRRFNFPEAGITSLRCYLDLTGLPPNYVGGLLTTNSIASRSIPGGPSVPPGYVQPSIATIRLWKKRVP